MFTLRSCAKRALWCGDDVLKSSCELLFHPSTTSTNQCAERLEQQPFGGGRPVGCLRLEKPPAIKEGSHQLVNVRPGLCVQWCVS